MRDYTGQFIYLGIDVHKLTYSVTAIHQGQIIKRDKMQACPQKLVLYCKKFFIGASIYSAYEAGFCGFSLHRYLIENGINNIVVHAASIEIAARERVKNDKRDSLKIATQLSAGRLNCIYIPSIEREAFRSISRLREKLIRDKTRLSVQMKSFLNLNGMISSSKRVSRSWVLDFLSISDDREIFFYLKTLAKRWIATDDEIKIIEEKLKEQASKEIDLEKIYRSVPGIGPIASRLLINELGDMSQFKNERVLFSYTGLTPREYSSGENVRVGHISRQGKPVLRRILVQAAWTAIKKDKGLKKIFEKISIRAGKKKAIIGIARRLIGHVRACLQKNEPYKYKEI